ncbi:MAG: hypothetical protein K8L99_18370, partial [Anaerolineae bacterium]|nr:hypothetical protein [Anaerolineae bacterium]
MRKDLILLICPILMVCAGDFDFLRLVESRILSNGYFSSSLLIEDETPTEGDCSVDDDVECGSALTTDPDQNTPEPNDEVEATTEVGAEICTPESYVKSNIQVAPADSEALIDAINEANADPDLSIICLTDSIYRLVEPNNDSGGAPTGLPAITSEIVILGNNTIISRDSEDAFRIIYVGEDGILTLNGITIENGRVEGEANGAGIFVDTGELRVTSSTFS